MALRSNLDTWGSVTKALHWLIALAIILLFCVGWFMKGLPNSPDKIKVYALHKSMGLTVLALVVLRIAWRLGEAHPANPPGMPPWQARASTVVHLGLYAIMLGMPLSGWLFNSAANFPLRWFGQFKVPALVGADAGTKALAGAIHFYGAWLLALLFVVHVAGALKHHYLERDAVLRRMLPGAMPAAARRIVLEIPQPDAAPAPTAPPSAPGAS